MSKKGLVLEGGGHRGIYSAGVLDVLRENNILADGVIGVSAGAIHGASYVSGQIGRSIRYTTKYCNDKRYMSIGSLIKTGDLFNVDFCYRALPFELDIFDTESFNNSSIKYYAVCTDVETGNAVYHHCTELNENSGMRYLQASASMPLAAKIVEINGAKLLDGGVADSIPLETFEHFGFDKNIVVLTQAAGYRKSKNALMPLIKMWYRKYPELIKISANRHNIYNESLKYVEEKAAKGEIILIRPSKRIEISRIEKNPQKIQDMYNLGRTDAITMLQKIKAFWA